MKYFFTSVFFLLLQCGSYAQAPFITAGELNRRMAQGKDTLYVVNFWATWCGPCLHELVHFEKLQQQFKTQKIKVLLVNLDFETQYKSAVAPFLKKQKLTAEVRLLRTPDQQAFINSIDTAWSGALPATLFVQGSRRRFFEKEFTFSELAQTCQNFTQ